MPIPVICEQCQSKFRAPDNAANRKIKCPKCAHVILVGQITKQTTNTTTDSTTQQVNHQQPNQSHINPQAKPTISNDDFLNFIEQTPDTPAVIQPKSTNRNNNKQRAAPPRTVERSIFQDADGPLYVKMIFAAIIAPIAVLAIMGKQSRRSGKTIFDNPGQLIGVIICLAIAGAVAGGLLGMRDIVLRRIKRNQPVTGILKLLYANGVVSLILWFVGLFITIAVGSMLMIIFTTK